MTSRLDKSYGGKLMFVVPAAAVTAPTTGRGAAMIDRGQDPVRVVPADQALGDPEALPECAGREALLECAGPVVRADLVLIVVIAGHAVTFPGAGLIRVGVPGTRVGMSVRDAGHGVTTGVADDLRGRTSVRPLCLLRVAGPPWFFPSRQGWKT